MKRKRNVHPQMCGNCGGEQFRIGAVEVEGDSRHPLELYTLCVGCGSISVIKVRPAKLEIDFGSDGSDGCLCPK